MRLLRVCAVTAVALGVSLAPTVASAQVEQISVGAPRLVYGGAAVVVPLTFTCDVGFNVAFGDVNVTQVSGHKLAQGFGSFVNDFPGVPCTGAPETITVAVGSASSFAFKQGRATASADVTVFNPNTFDLITEVADPQPVRITR
jgi:hypothetical protein